MLTILRWTVPALLAVVTIAQSLPRPDVQGVPTKGYLALTGARVMDGTGAP